MANWLDMANVRTSCRISSVTLPSCQPVTYQPPIQAHIKAKSITFYPERPASERVNLVAAPPGGVLVGRGAREYERYLRPGTPEAAQFNRTLASVTPDEIARLTRMMRELGVLGPKS